MFCVYLLNDFHVDIFFDVIYLFLCIKNVLQKHDFTLSNFEQKHFKLSGKRFAIEGDVMFLVARISQSARLYLRSGAVLRWIAILSGSSLILSVRRFISMDRFDM